uniref:Uncharacterized protein n=1 Tax=Romanomermis culicivorax TaxID=13658 RepID=A0A915JV32_ROMCU
MTSTVTYSRKQTRRRKQGMATILNDQQTPQEPNLAVVLEHLNDLCSFNELQGRAGEVDLSTLIHRMENSFEDWTKDYPAKGERRRIIVELLENGQKQNLCTNVGGDLWRNGPSTDDTASYKSLEKGTASTRDRKLLTQPSTEPTRSLLVVQTSPAIESKPRRRSAGGVSCEKCNKPCEKEVQELKDKNYDLDCLYCALKALYEKKDAQELEKARLLSLEEVERREREQKATDLALAQKAHEESRKSSPPKVEREKPALSSCPECRKRAQSGGKKLYTLEEALEMLRQFGENDEKKMTVEEMESMMATSMQKERQKELSQQSIMVYGKPSPPPKTVNPEKTASPANFPTAAFHQHEVAANSAQDEHEAKERRRKARRSKSAKKSKSSSKKSSEKKKKKKQKQKSSKKTSSKKGSSKKGKKSKMKERQEKKKSLDTR